MHDGRFIIPVGTEIIFEFFGAARDRSIVIVDMSRLQHEIQPVGGDGIADLFGREDRRPAAVVGRAAVRIISPVVEKRLLAVDVHQVHECRAVDHIKVLVVADVGIAAVICDRRLSGLAFLGGDENNAVGRTDSVDGSRGVLEDLYRFDIRRIESSEGAAADR